MTTFAALKANLKEDFSSFRKVRLGILADSTTHLLAEALRGEGYHRQLNVAVCEGPYGQILQQVVDTSSELYTSTPELVLVYQAVEKLLVEFQRTGRGDRAAFADEHLASVDRLVREIAPRCDARVVYFNFPELNDGVFGSFSNKVHTSFLYQLRRINLGLMDLARRHANLHIVDVAVLAAQHGRAIVTDPRIALRTEILFGMEFLPHLARATLDVIDAWLGRAKKCLILDLDNTLWGGVIGDDGLEGIEIGGLGNGAAYSQIQAWAKQLKERGIVLAVCSKNEDPIAREPFEKHPDMVLRLEDIAVFKANWDNKAENIRLIQSVLQIGFDSMVFLDDNPAEREQVRRAIPEVCVPELPEDPALYVPFLRDQNLFETVSVIEEDALRTQQYQEESKRQALQENFADESDFLRSLEMVATVEEFTAFNIPRVAQLSQRSNQFNLRTVRYSEDEIAKIQHSSEHVPFAFSLRDRFGNYGLVSVIILKKKAGDSLFIDTWLMSCRVLKRGLESLALNSLVATARRLGFRSLVGEYIPTKKNILVKDHYAKLGFKPIDGHWEVDVGSYVDRVHFINEG